MRKQLRRSTTIAFALGSLVALSTAPVAAAELEVGSPFPIIELPTLEDGSRASIRDYRGKKLMLHVWASW